MTKEKYKLYSIIICILFIIGILIGRFSEIFRFNFDQHWIYEYGNYLSYLIIFGSVIWSIINALRILNRFRYRLKNKIIWILISLLPILYILFGIGITIIKI